MLKRVLAGHQLAGSRRFHGYRSTKSITTSFVLSAARVFGKKARTASNIANASSVAMTLDAFPSRSEEPGKFLLPDFLREPVLSSTRVLAFRQGLPGATRRHQSGRLKPVHPLVALFPPEPVWPRTCCAVLVPQPLQGTSGRKRRTLELASPSLSDLTSKMRREAPGRDGGVQAHQSRTLSFPAPPQTPGCG